MDLPALNEPITRRNFLQLSSLGMLGLLVPRQEAEPLSEPEPLGYGRVIDPVLGLRSGPSTTASVVRYTWRDVVLPISAVTVGDDPQAYNRFWYQVDEGSFAYSGSLQPVEIQPQAALRRLPAGGQLVEVSVPFSDALKEPLPSAPPVYRLYYGTTHWAKTVETVASGDTWYGLFDDRLHKLYYVLARHLRPVPPDELGLLSPQVPLADKRLEVDRRSQVVTAYEAGRAVFRSRAATGARWATGNYETPQGTFIIDHKAPSSHMAAGDRAAPNSYDLPGVPWVCYFTEDGVAFHGTYWHNDFGRPRSHGCVNLPTFAARWVYRWSLPVVPSGEALFFAKEGVRVEVG